MQDIANEAVTLWAHEEYGRAELGDARLTGRAVQMLGRVMERRAGKITEVFATEAERKGAYRLLENDQVLAETLIDAAASACARRSAAYPVVIVPVDGSSAKLADPMGALGAIGTYEAGARGIKVISAIALSPAGEPLGVCHQEQWMRPPKARPKRKARRRGRSKEQQAKARRRAKKKDRAQRKRPVHQKETQRWIDTILTTKRRFEDHAPQTKCWFQIDREADAWPVLQALLHHRPDDLLTVRATFDRRVKRADGSRGYLLPTLASAPPLGGCLLEVPAGYKRTARRAHLLIHVAAVVVDARDERTDRHHDLPLYAVWVHEVGTTPAGEKPLDWVLLTNHPSDTLDQAQLVIDAYTLRWRIEEVHKSWKSGGCGIESSQLHTAPAVMKWSTILFTVAVRIERIKFLARTSPDVPASVELSFQEIRALRLLKRKQKKRTETIPDTMPTIAQAARWIADLGGYTGKSSGGPFGSITLGRGLTKVVTAASVLEALDEESKM
jgi:hypothetical protein